MKQADELLDEQEFYEKMQRYRLAPIGNQKEVTRAFEDVKQWIRDNYTVTEDKMKQRFEELLKREGVWDAFNESLTRNGMELGKKWWATLAETEEQTILDEAKALVYGDRENDYSHPYYDFGCTSELWTAYLKSKYKIDFSLEREDIGLMMVLFKVSRESRHPKRDNLVDGAGYLETVQRVIDKRKDEA